MKHLPVLFLLVATLFAGCGGCGGSSPRDDVRWSGRDSGPSRQTPAARPTPPPPPRPPTPEEAMELDLATPLAAAVEHWIADTDLGDAWKQAKENVADLRARLVADYKARQESGVGDTPSSIKMRKDYDRWLSVHDRLKAFILDCRASNAIGDLPPDLAKHFRNYPALRRELLRDAPASLDSITNKLDSIRNDFASLRDSDGTTEARLATAESIDSRVAALRAKAEGLQAGADEVARHYATDDAVADIASRAADVAADAKAIGAKVSAFRDELHDAEAVRLFEGKVAAFEQGAARLDELVAAKAARETSARELANDITQDIQAKNFATLAGHRARLASLLDAASAARAVELECARAVKGTAKDFSGTLGAKAVRTIRQTLVSDASVARVTAISKRAETAAGRYGKTLESALLNLQNSAFKLEDGAAETAALAEAQKRLDRLDALSKRQ